MDMKKIRRIDSHIQSINSMTNLDSSALTAQQARDLANFAEVVRREALEESHALGLVPLYKEEDIVPGARIWKLLATIATTARDQMIQCSQDIEQSAWDAGEKAGEIYL